jgi:Putative Actinobacterial Holin-X, holin superfamily III
MVAHTEPTPPDGGSANDESRSAQTGERFSSEGGRTNPGGLRRLVSSIARLTDIQLQIWLTRAKLAAFSVAFYAALFGAAAVVSILGIIFLFIGLFRVLTDVVGLAPVWAFLIFGGVQLLLAGVLVAIARSVFIKRMASKKPGGGK